MVDPKFFPLDKLRDLMDPKFVNKQKINCIKHLRQITGEGLKETKEFFELEWRPFVNGALTPTTVPTELVSDNPEFEHLRNQVQNLADEVADLRSMNTRSREATIFKEED